MKLLKTELCLGAERPFTIVHASDTHLTDADIRNDQRKINLAQERLPMFPNAKAMLEEIEKAAKEHDAVVIHTGDLIDFVSYANLDCVREFMNKVDCFMSAGNHEYSQYVGEAFEDAAYREQSLELVQSAFKNDIRFASRIINGINFVAIDNSYYLFDEWQLNRLKDEVNKGLPIVLCMHTPLYSEDIYNQKVDDTEPEVCAYLMCVPDEKMKKYSPYRVMTQRPDDITREAYQYISKEPMIKAILTGHLHIDFEHVLFGRIPQIAIGTETIHIVTIS